MSFLQAIILGIVEGITEFLPISSTGHLIITGELLGLPRTELLKSFDIAIQLGAILAAVMLYGKMLVKNRHTFLIVAAGFIPTGVVGLLGHRFVKTYLFGLPTVTTALFLGGIALILFEIFMQRRAPTVLRTENITLKQAALIGLAQSIALIPGASRSAMTIMAGMLLGMERRVIVEFSFLLAIPTMTAATGYDLLKNGSSFSMDQFGVLAVGFIVSFLVALLAVKTFLSYIQRHSFAAFGWYRILLAVLFLIFLLK